jgi:hypothetical protein
MLAVAGGFTADNYGDQLYPWVLERLIRALGVEDEIRFLSPFPGQTRDGRAIHPLSSLATNKPRAIVVGGGDIIRTDLVTVAQDHLNASMRMRQGRLGRLRAKRIVRRYLSTGPGPWLLADPRWVGGIPLGWASVGVRQLEPKPLLEEAIAAVSAAWIRTTRGVDAAIAAGVPRERCSLGPDAVFAIGSVIDLEYTKDTGDRLLHDATGVPGERVAVVHAAPFTGWNATTLERLFGSSRGIPMVFLSMGRYVREDRELERAAKTLELPLLRDLDVTQITAVLAAAGSVTTTSMHAAIVASALGRPVLVPGTLKTLDAFAACPSAPPLHLVDDETVVGRIADLTGHTSAPVSAENSEVVNDRLRWLLTEIGV